MALRVLVTQSVHAFSDPLGGGVARRTLFATDHSYFILDDMRRCHVVRHTAQCSGRRGTSSPKTEAQMKTCDLGERLLAIGVAALGKTSRW